MVKGKQKQISEHQKTLQSLRDTKELYVIMSMCTKMPFVQCDTKTFDDEIFVFFQLGDAQGEGKRLIEKKEPVNIYKLENKQLLSFYLTLFTIGVNCIVVNHGMEDEVHVQLGELVKKPDPAKMPKGAVWVENPEFHLTALYIMQEVRKQQKAAITDELKEMQEEMLAHYGKGNYIVALKEKKSAPILKMKNGDMLQPVFTDVFEFQKFNRKKELGFVVVKAEKIPEILAAEAKGIVVNPLGVNIPLSIIKRGAPRES